MEANQSEEYPAAMTTTLRHIALFVENLQAAEQYYQSIFDMELIGREALLHDGLWYTLPPDKSWEEAGSAGIDLGMSALRKGAFVLALFRGQAKGGQIYVLGLQMPVEEIARARTSLPEGTFILEASGTSLTFQDPYQITWQISAPGGEFRTAGDFANRWLHA